VLLSKERDLTIMASSIPILTFHAVDDRPSVISLSPRVFRRGMGRLHDSGYRTLTLLEAVDCLRQRKTFPVRSFVITFDDGYQTVFDKAFPLLQRYGMSATVFLTVGERRMPNLSHRLPSLQGRSMLSWEEIAEMKRCGIDFGSHTLTHPDLTRLSLERVAIEIQDSKAIIEDALSTPINCFAYPYGRHDHRSREIVKNHFACACSDTLGMINPGSDLYALKRIDAYYLRTDMLFDLMLTRFFPWYVRTRNITRRIRRAFQSSLI